jgi:hypothetical protein
MHVLLPVDRRLAFPRKSTRWIYFGFDRRSRRLRASSSSSFSSADRKRAPMDGDLFYGAASDRRQQQQQQRFEIHDRYQLEMRGLC